MKDREFENYLALLSGMLRLRRTQREGIAGELRDHLIEHVAHLEASGIAHEEAVRRALEEFGDTAALAANFQALVGMRRRRLIMRCTIGTTIVMTGLVVALLAFRPDVVDDPGIARAQDGPK
ncbi:MAG TPA: permease prefix domain 1-containing protein, partial [Pirellulales bacterium]|nr:permease prefix domain 1-containing protein [Pirellulales bacterium]